MRSRNLCFAILVMLAGRLCSAQEITVAAAADLQFVLPDIATRFQKESGKHVKLIFGSSGNFFAQIQNGAPFDLFFSADIDYPRRLETADLAEPGTLYAYARGKIVLWIPRESKLDLSHGLRVLLDPAIRKISIANPEHAPYGRAAVAAMRQERVYEDAAAKFVLGENISQAASFVMSGSADAGIVALSLALAPAMKEKGRYVEIPGEEYPVLEQAAVVLKSSRHKDTALEFLTFMKSAAVRNLLGSYGFSVPGSAAVAPRFSPK